VNSLRGDGVLAGRVEVVVDDPRGRAGEARVHPERHRSAREHLGHGDADDARQAHAADLGRGVHGEPPAFRHGGPRFLEAGRGGDVALVVERAADPVARAVDRGEHFPRQAGGLVERRLHRGLVELGVTWDLRELLADLELLEQHELDVFEVDREVQRAHGASCGE
jgi:hypothetical protein